MAFNKVLVGKYSPENKCFAADGEYLIIGQPEHKMKGKLPEDHHFFVGIFTKHPSRYGWVKNLSGEITPDDLAEKFTGNPSIQLIESCRLLLESASKYEEGTPVACMYKTIGILDKKKIPKVHKIFFYNEKGTKIK